MQASLVCTSTWHFMAKKTHLTRILLESAGWPIPSTPGSIPTQPNGSRPRCQPSLVSPGLAPAWSGLGSSNGRGGGHGHSRVLDRGRGLGCIQVWGVGMGIGRTGPGAGVRASQGWVVSGVGPGQGTRMKVHGLKWPHLTLKPNWGCKGHSRPCKWHYSACHGDSLSG